MVNGEKKVLLEENGVTRQCPRVRRNGDGLKAAGVDGSWCVCHTAACLEAGGRKLEVEVATLIERKGVWV